jgi:hypothetical protein
MWRFLFAALSLLLGVTGYSAPDEQSVTPLEGPAVVLFYTDG